MKTYLLITILISTLCFASLQHNSAIKVGSADGLGHFAGDGLTNYPIGAAYIYEQSQPDIFIWHLPDVRVSDNTDTQVVLYKWLGEIDDVPVFGEPAVCTHNFGRKYVPFEIIEKDGDIHFLWRGGMEIIHTRFLKEKKSFEKIAAIDLTGVIFLSQRPHAAKLNPDNSLVVITDRRYGDYFGEQGKEVAKRGPFFIPYDGRGAWRGEIPMASLYGFGLDLFTSQKAYDCRKISKNPDSIIGSFGQKSTFVNLGIGRERDIVAGGQFGNFHYYRNLADTGVDLDKRRYVVDGDGVAIRNPNIDASPIAYPNGKTGFSDILSCSEGLMFYYKFTGEFTDSGSPIYEDSRKVWLKDAALNTGSLPVINVADWDGDGLLDIISGTSNGQVLFSKNIGTKQKPAFAPFKTIKAEGKKIWVKPGYRGSLQGPLEARWGYSCPTVVDWNGNGIPDLLVSGSTAEFTMYINKGTKNNPQLAAGKPLYHDGLELHGAWRTQPAAGLLNERMVVIIFDNDDELRMYGRIDDYNVEDLGKLRLYDGSTIISTFKYGSGSGRIKLQLTDWDGDGIKDLLIGTQIDSSIPNRKTGLPSSLDNSHAVVLFMKNVGTEANPLFAYPEVLEAEGVIRNFGVHACSPAAADLTGDGKKDLIVGEERGRFHFFDGNEIAFRKIVPEKDLPVLNCRWERGTVQNNWNIDENWLYGVPRKTDNAFIERDVVVNISGKAECLNLFLGGNGAVLKTGETSQIEVENDLVVGLHQQHSAVLIVEGGKINVGGRLHIARNENSAGVLVCENIFGGYFKFLCYNAVTIYY